MPGQSCTRWRTEHHGAWHKGHAAISAGGACPEEAGSGDGGPTSEESAPWVASKSAPSRPPASRRDPWVSRCIGGGPSERYAEDGHRSNVPPRRTHPWSGATAPRNLEAALAECAMSPMELVARPESNETNLDSGRPFQHHTLRATISGTDPKCELRRHSATTPRGLASQMRPKGRRDVSLPRRRHSKPHRTRGRSSRRATTRSTVLRSVAEAPHKAQGRQATRRAGSNAAAARQGRRTQKYGRCRGAQILRTTGIPCIAYSRTGGALGGHVPEPRVDNCWTTGRQPLDNGKARRDRRGRFGGMRGEQLFGNFILSATPNLAAITRLEALWKLSVHVQKHVFGNVRVNVVSLP